MCVRACACVLLGFDPEEKKHPRLLWPHADGQLQHATDTLSTVFFFLLLFFQLMKRPAKYSKELLDWRRRQNMLARQKNYAEAQKIKRIADVMEERERKSIDTENRKIFARKEAQLRKQQQSELQALLKRVEGRRREHIKQRNLDSKRLLQRNRNVQAVLEAKQSMEAKLANEKIRATLSEEGRSKRDHHRDRASLGLQPKKRKKKKKRVPGNDGGGTTFLTQGR